MPQDCSYALIPDATIQNISFLQKIALHHMVDEEKFNQAKQNIGVSGSIPIGDIIVTPKMNWAQFNEEKTKKLNEYRFDSTTELNSDFYSSMLSSVSLDAYRACLNANKPIGLVMMIVDGGPFSEQVTVRVSFNTARGDVTQRRFYDDGFNYSLTESSKKKLGAAFKGAAEFNIHFKRNVNERTSFSVDVSNAGGDGEGAIIIPPRPRVFKNIPNRQRKEKSFKANASNGNTIASTPVTMYPDDGWKFDVNTPITWNITTEGNVNTYQVTPNGLTSTSAGVMLHLDCGGGQDCGFSGTFSAVQVQDPVWIDVTDKPELIG